MATNSKIQDSLKEEQQEPVKTEQQVSAVTENQDTTSAEKNVLLIHDPEKDTVSTAKEIKGNPKVEPVSPSKMNSLHSFDPNSDILTAFLKTLVSQFKNPDKLILYSIPEKILSAVLKVSDNEVKLVLSPQEQQKYQVDTKNLIEKQPGQAETVKQKRFPVDENKIDWEMLKTKWGISKEYIKSQGAMDDLLYGKRTNKALRIYARTTTGERLSIDAKLELRYDTKGEINFFMHGIKTSPNLSQEFFGHSFSDEDKKNLLSENGNMGRVVHLKFSEKNTIPCLISRDKITNDILYMPQSWIKVPDQLKGITLSDEQKKLLSEGQTIESNNFISSKGKTFAAKVQYDVEKKGFVFIYPDKLIIGKKLCGVDLSEQQQKDLKAGKEVFIEGMVNRNNGHKFNNYVRADFSNNKFVFSNNPAIEIAPKPKEENKPVQKQNRPGKNSKRPSQHI